MQRPAIPLRIKRQSITISCAILGNLTEHLILHSSHRYSSYQNVRKVDGYSTQPLTSFEQKLKLKMDTIRSQEEQLKQKIASLKKDKIDPAMRREILTTHSLIERSKKFTAILVEQMQKSLHSISPQIFHG